MKILLVYSDDVTYRCCDNMLPPEAGFFVSDDFTEDDERIYLEKYRIFIKEESKKGYGLISYAEFLEKHIKLEKIEIMESVE